MVIRNSLSAAATMVRPMFYTQPISRDARGSMSYCLRVLSPISNCLFNSLPHLLAMQYWDNLHSLFVPHLPLPYILKNHLPQGFPERMNELIYAWHLIVSLEYDIVYMCELLMFLSYSKHTKLFKEVSWTNEHICKPDGYRSWECQNALKHPLPEIEKGLGSFYLNPFVMQQNSSLHLNIFYFAENICPFYH